MRDKLVIDNGTVNCPRRGDTDVELCSTCPELLDMGTDGGHEFVVCSGREVVLEYNAPLA